MDVKRIGNNQQNFGRLHRTIGAKYYLQRLPKEKQNYIDLLELYNRNVSVAAYAYTRKILGKERLLVDVGPKVFKEIPFFRGPVKTIEKALEFANKYSEHLPI